MSHFVRLETEFQERDRLIESLRELGHEVEEGERLEVRGDRRRSERAEIVVRAAPGADIGFRRSGDAYEVVADWYRVEQSSPVRRDAFLAGLKLRYAYRVVLDQAKEQNLIVEEEKLANGDIVLVLTERG
jgi:hypothetical protein